MRIVFCCETMRNGGAEKVIATLSNEFSNAGHEVVIIMVSENNNSSFYNLNKKVKLIALCENQDHIRHNIFKKVQLLKLNIENEHPDIVVSFLKHIIVYSYFALKHLNIPFVVSERNYPRSYPIYYRLVLKLIFKKANGCVFQTEDSEKWYGVSKNKAIIIPNPINVLCKNEEHKSKEKVIFSVGRLVKQKNFKLLIKSFYIFSKEHPGFRLRIYGDGPLKARLNRLIRAKKLENSVEIMGVSNDWHKKEFNSSVFVLTSLYEGLPNALAEALYLGIPCVSVCSKNGGPSYLSTYFKNQCLLSKSFNPNEISKKITEAINLDFDLDYDVKDTFSETVVASKWLNYFDKIIEK